MFCLSAENRLLTLFTYIRSGLVLQLTDVSYPCESELWHPPELTKVKL